MNAQSREHAQGSKQERGYPDRVDDERRREQPFRVVAVRHELADGAHDAHDAEDDGVHPSRGPVQAVARADDERQDERGDVDDELRDGDVAPVAEGHCECGGLVWSDTIEMQAGCRPTRLGVVNRARYRRTVGREETSYLYTSRVSLRTGTRLLAQAITNKPPKTCISCDGRCAAAHSVARVEAKG